jgi:hypothetical protein
MRRHDGLLAACELILGGGGMRPPARSGLVDRPLEDMLSYVLERECLGENGCGATDEQLAQRAFEKQENESYGQHWVGRHGQRAVECR